MKVIFEGECVGIVKHSNDTFASCIEWNRGNNYSKESIYVNQRLELGQKIWVTVTDTDPDESADVLPPTEFTVEVPPAEPVEKPVTY